MKAAVYNKFGGSITIEEVPEPETPADGVVIRVGATGLCRSDWHGWMGHDPTVDLPHVPGHELAGVIEAIGPEVRRWRPGQRVTLPFALGCGWCRQCAAGNQHICDNYYQPGFTGWGSFAEYVAVPHADVNLVALPQGLDDVAAASLGCRFITSFRAVVHQGRLRGGEWAAVHGCGGVGLAAIMIAAALGAQVIGVDIREEALEMARAVGATHVINGETAVDLPAEIADLSGGGAHVAIDALGITETCRNAVLSLRKRGRHVQVGYMAGDHRDTPIPMDRVMGYELEIIGSHGMQAHAYDQMLEMIQAGTLRPQQLIGDRIPLQRAPKALVAMGDFAHTGVTVIDRFEE